MAFLLTSNNKFGICDTTAEGHNIITNMSGNGAFVMYVRNGDMIYTFLSKTSSATGTPVSSTAPAINPDTTTSPASTITDIPLCLNVYFNGNNYVYKHDDHRIWTDGKRFSLIFDKYFVQPWNESFDVNHDSSLTNVDIEILSDGGYSGCLRITGDICWGSYMHHIYLNVNTITTHKPTTMIPDGVICEKCGHEYSRSGLNNNDGCPRCGDWHYTDK